MKFSTLCVIGMGYIGLPYASVFASKGVRVTGMDTNTAIIEGLQAGKSHIVEPGLQELVVKVLASGHLTISTEVVSADAFIIAVPTPFDTDKRADLRAVIAASQSIVPHLRRGNLVILESTSPPRTTTDVVTPILEKSGLKAGEDFLLAYSPERVLPGRILQELVENPRVIGGIDRTSAEAGRGSAQDRPRAARIRRGTEFRTRCSEGSPGNLLLSLSSLSRPAAHPRPDLP